MEKVKTSGIYKLEKGFIAAVYENDFGALIDTVIGRAMIEGYSCGRSWALNVAAHYLNLAGWNRGISFYWALLSFDEPETLTEDDVLDYLSEEALNEYERIHGADGELAQKRGVKAW